MVGILLITHHSLGENLIDCARHVTGKAHAALSFLSVHDNDDVEHTRGAARKIIGDLDQGDGVLVLADIYGATPANITRQLLEPGKVEGIAGASLPMLVRALTHRNEPLVEVVRHALSAAKECVLRMEPADDRE